MIVGTVTHAEMAAMVDFIEVSSPARDRGWRDATRIPTCKILVVGQHGITTSRKIAGRPGTPARVGVDGESKASSPDVT